MKVKINRLCVILLLIAVVALIIAPTIADAQVLPGPIRNDPVITYTPPDEITWICEDSQGDEIVTVKELASNEWQFDITPDPSKLFYDDISNYPYEVFRLEYPGTMPHSQPVKVPVSTKDYSVRTVPKDKLVVSGIVRDNKLSLYDNDGLTFSMDPSLLAGTYIKYGPHSATYSAVSNAITVTGGTEGSPVTFQDIYDADVANGWGVVTRSGTCTNCYCIDAKILFGDGSTTTWFTDTDKQVTFTGSALASNGQRIMDVTANAYVQFGTLSDVDKYSTVDGCAFYVMDSPTASWGTLFYGLPGYSDRHLYLYSSFLTANGDSLSSYTTRTWNVLKTGGVAEICGNIYNLTSNSSGLQGYSGSVYDRVSISGASRAIRHWGNTDYTYSNIIARDNTYILWRDAGTTGGNTYLINVDADDWSIYWSNAAAARVYRQYEFDCMVTTDAGTPIQNAIVQISTNAGTVVANTVTSASGTITQQTLTYGTYRQANGDTPSMHTPHSITITADGYLPYESVVTIDTETSLHIALTEIPEDTTATMLQAWMQSNIIDWLEVGFMETITGLIFVLAIVALAFRYGGWLLHIFASMVCFGFGIYYFDNELIIYSVPLICLGMLIIGQELNLMVSRRKHR